MNDADDSKGKRQPTIVEVADRAGVAIGTVSRYLNGQPVRVGNRTQIAQAIHQLGYRRNALAAAMKSELTNTVGFMVPNISEFHAAVLEHLSRLMRQQGRALLTYCHNDDSASVLDLLDFFDSHRVDCLIMDGRSDAADRIQEFVESGTPVIFYDNDADGPAADRVFVENRAASFRAVCHLLDIGHTKVAVLTGDTKVFAGRERYEGYRQALISRGLEINPDYVLDSHWSENEAYSGMLQLLTLPDPPTALYCCNYNIAVGALRRIKERGLKVPDDISFISFDDVPLFRLHESGITAIAQPVAKIAETINSILMTRLSDRSDAHAPNTITLDCDIILRGSTRRYSAS
ncbi:MAG: LacI family DNA-binding transcriptional regulator [Devosia nanyangense]|uniref:LacI family DNA-binding transcriptional regulator n=1 Tax=Devosia nanyangense TaxID=1228055 RepID=A0A933L0A3_9HYPH|nr:LacI family DNA-binding transcriptional regulator [Devosia nanyangense]